MSYYGSNQNYGGGGGGGFNAGASQPNSTFRAGYGDPNSWQQQQQPQYDQQQPQYGQQQQYGQQPGQQQSQQQQQQQQQPSLWNPAAAASMATMAASAFASGGANNEQMLNMAGQAAGTFLQSSTARMIPGLEMSMMALRQYFAVDNRYVLHKLKRVLLPFLCKGWKRQQQEFAPSSSDGIPTMKYELPKYDECAPDLYLPFMSGITYVLMCALLYGTAGQFNPEVIPGITTTCFVWQTLEVLCMRLGFYLLQVPVAMLDLFSYTGYKYVGLCLNMMVGLIVGHFGMGSRGYYGAFLWTATCMAYFMLKTMANNVPENTSAQGPKREAMVIGFAASQFATMWLMSQTKLL